jgi:hypothetical protein
MADHVDLEEVVVDTPSVHHTRGGAATGETNRGGPRREQNSGDDQAETFGGWDETDHGSEFDDGAFDEDYGAENEAEPRGTVHSTQANRSTASVVVNPTFDIGEASSRRTNQGVNSNESATTKAATAGPKHGKNARTPGTCTATEDEQSSQEEDTDDGKDEATAKPAPSGVGDVVGSIGTFFVLVVI